MIHTRRGSEAPTRTRTGCCASTFRKARIYRSTPRATARGRHRTQRKTPQDTRGITPRKPCRDYCQAQKSPSLQRPLESANPQRALSWPGRLIGPNRARPCVVWGPAVGRFPGGGAPTYSRPRSATTMRACRCSEPWSCRARRDRRVGRGGRAIRLLGGDDPREDQGCVRSRTRSATGRTTAMPPLRLTPPTRLGHAGRSPGSPSRSRGTPACRRPSRTGRSGAASPGC